MCDACRQKPVRVGDEREIDAGRLCVEGRLAQASRDVPGIAWGNGGNSPAGDETLCQHHDRQRRPPGIVDLVHDGFSHIEYSQHGGRAVAAEPKPRVRLL